MNPTHNLDKQITFSTAVLVPRDYWLKCKTLLYRLLQLVCTQFLSGMMVISALSLPLCLLISMSLCVCEWERDREKQRQKEESV